MTATTTTAPLFRPAQNTTAFLKMGLLGFQGSGKTKTAAKTAIGLVNHLKKLNIAYANKPVYFLDTETGSDWVMPDFQEAGIPLEPAKTRAFSDLIAGVQQAEKEASVLLIDSVSHFWKELCESYCRRKAQQFKPPRQSYSLQLKDWGYLKGPQGWGKFSELFVNSRIHIILAGRAGYEFDMSEDEDGTKHLEKTGIKMKAEGEFGYEPSLLVYMERHQKIVGDKIEKVWREATIMKDRAAVIDGASFENPGFEDFMPHVGRLNLGGQQLGVDTSRTSDVSIPQDAPRDKTSLQRGVVIDEINDLLLHHNASGTSAADKKKRSDLMQQHFGTVSKTAIEELMPLWDLRAGYDSLHADLEGKPSRYGPAVQSAAAPARTIAEDINDSLPDYDETPSATVVEFPTKPPTVKARLLADIPALTSATDCLSWGLAMHDTFETLSKGDKEDVQKALLARQAGLTNGSGHGYHA